MILLPIFKTSIGILVRKDGIQKSKLSKYGNNISYFIDGMLSNYTIIFNKGGFHEDYVHHILELSCQNQIPFSTASLSSSRMSGIQGERLSQETGFKGKLKSTIIWLLINNAQIRTPSTPILLCQPPLFSSCRSSIFIHNQPQPKINQKAVYVLIEELKTSTRVMLSYSITFIIVT